MEKTLYTMNNHMFFLDIDKSNENEAGFSSVCNGFETQDTCKTLETLEYSKDTSESSNTLDNKSLDSVLCSEKSLETSETQDTCKDKVSNKKALDYDLEYLKQFDKLKSLDFDNKDDLSKGFDNKDDLSKGFDNKDFENSKDLQNFTTKDNKTLEISKDFDNTTQKRLSIFCKKSKDFVILYEISENAYENALNRNILNLFSCSIHEKIYTINSLQCDFNYFMIYSKTLDKKANKNHLQGLINQDLSLYKDNTQEIENELKRLKGVENMRYKPKNYTTSLFSHEITFENAKKRLSRKKGRIAKNKSYANSQDIDLFNFDTKGLTRDLHKKVAKIKDRIVFLKTYIKLDNRFYVCKVNAGLSPLMILANIREFVKFA